MNSFSFTFGKFEVSLKDACPLDLATTDGS